MTYCLEEYKSQLSLLVEKWPLYFFLPAALVPPEAFDSPGCSSFVVPHSFLSLLLSFLQVHTILLAVPRLSYSILPTLVPLGAHESRFSFLVEHS